MKNFNINNNIEKAVREMDFNTKLIKTHRATTMLRNKREDLFLLRELTESLGIINDEDDNISIDMVDSVGRP